MKRILLALVFASALHAAPPTPDAKLSELQSFAGHWTCQGTAFPFLGMPQHETRATIDAAWTMDGHWLEVHYKEPKTAANATPVEVRYNWGWDAQTKRLASVAVDNGGGHFIQSSPGWEGASITFEGDMHIAGTTMRFHDVFTKSGNAKLSHKGEAMMDGKWTKLDEESCTR